MKLKLFISTLLISLSLSVPSSAATLSDIDEHWAKKDIQQLVNLEIFGGYPDQTFRPDNSITRAEFAKILCKALALPENNKTSAFADTDEHWANCVITPLVQKQIIYPAEYTDNLYWPDSKITRREIAIMLVRALELNEAAIELCDQDTGFADQAQFNSYDVGYILLAKINGLIGGYEDNTFRANNSATRAEAGVMLLRFMTLINPDFDYSVNSPATEEEPEKDNSIAILEEKTINQVEFTIGKIQDYTITTNNLGEEYLTIIFDLTIANKSQEALQSTNNNLKIITEYSNGFAPAKIDAYQDIIPAGQTQTRFVAAHILLPTNQVAKLTLGKRIKGCQIYFTDQPTNSADVATPSNPSDHTVYFENLAKQIYKLAK